MLSNEIRFPELRKICLEQLANALCASDRADTSKNLISTIQGSIRGDSELVIDPETRGAIFDMLAKGYTPTNPVSYVASVSKWHVLRCVGMLTLGDLDPEPASQLVKSL